jgi:outer membrane protein assembly factor BamB
VAGPGGGNRGHLIPAEGPDAIALLPRDPIVEGHDGAAQAPPGQEAEHSGEEERGAAQPVPVTAPIGDIRLRESGDAPEWALNNFASYGIRYNRTGDEAWAEMYRALMLALVDYWDEHGPWPMEWLWDPYWAWDNAEEAPCFTDQERLRITNFLLDVGRTDRTRYAGSFTARNEISGGHQLDQNLCLFCLGDYFWKYYQHPEAREWLDVVDWRFTTSAKYHRLRHDANDYNHAAFWFLLRYARISGDWTWVESGQFARFVMYTQMMLDNLGYRAQNGDAGSPFAGPQAPMYSMASWFYQDGRYKWAIRDRTVTSPGHYANNIEPEMPEELLGLHRFDIEPTFYEYLSGHPADAEELPPEIVPIEDAWDKISLREAFDPRAQYLILDGMTAGEHGHDDANAVIRLTDNGRIWLVDCDYIRRAPKWHNSAVVIRDGASSSQPPLARCDDLHDFGDLALVRTTLPRYTGADWERNVFWRKGQWLAFVDNFVAREAGDYRLKVIWRTLGEAEINDGGDLHVRQAGARDEYAAFHPDCDEDGNGIPDGFTASFTNKWGETKAHSEVDGEVYHSEPAAIGIECEPQGYAVIYAYWPVEGGERYRFHTMCRTDTEPGCTATTTIYWTGAGRQRLPRSVGGGPQQGETDWQPMDIEDTAPEDAETAQVCIRLSAQGSDTASGTCWFDDLSMIHIAEDGTETVLFPREDLEPTWSHFHVKNADGAHPHLSSFLQRGHPRKDGYWVGYGYAGPEVKTLQQIADARLEPGQSRAFLNLLYTADDEEPRELQFRYLSPTAAVISGGEAPAIVAVRPAEGEPIALGPLRVDAEMACLEGAMLSAAGLRSVLLNGRELFASDEPVARAVELPSGDIATRLDVPEQPRRAEPPHFEAQGLSEVTAAQLGGEVRAICSADLDDDGDEEVIAGAADGTVTAMAADGVALWTFRTERAIRRVRAADVNGDGRAEVIVGGDDQMVRLLDSEGSEVWAHELEDFHSRDGRVVAMDVGDLAGDGRMGIVVGTEAWHWYALDAEGNQLWRRGHAHATTAGRLADLDGDGDLEVVTGTEYYSWPVYDHTGGSLWRMSGGPGVTALEVADLNGDGRTESLFGTGDCAASLRCMDADGAELWRRSLGDEPRDIVAVDLDGDGQMEVVASSDAMFLYAFAADGHPLWRIDSSDIIDVLAVRGSEVVAGSRDGTVHVVGDGGEVLARYPCGAAVTALEIAGDAIIAGLADGRVLRLR